MDICSAFGNYFEYLINQFLEIYLENLYLIYWKIQCFQKLKKKLLKFPKGIKSKNISATSGK